MIKELHYEHSPLIEAVIDLRVSESQNVNLDTLASVRADFEDEYPIVQSHYQGHIELAIGDEITAAAPGHQTGFVFVSSDSRQTVQVRLDGFTFSRRAPYENWQSFQCEARRWWEQYRLAVNPEQVTRVAVRYINRLNIPLPMSDFRDYLRTLPEVAPDLPQGLGAFFMQLQIPQEDAPVMLILSQALAEGADSTVVSVILDIDLFQDSGVPNQEEDIWSIFEWLRVRKNEVFEKCITERMKELIR